MKDLVSQQFGNYYLIHLRGKGGFAEIYLGQHVRLNMQAAIKVLQTHLADKDIEEFQREAQIIATLVHPHEVEQVVLTALTKDPKQRFGSVQAFTTY